MYYFSDPVGNMCQPGVGHCATEWTQAEDGTEDAIGRWGYYDLVTNVSLYWAVQMHYLIGIRRSCSMLSQTVVIHCIPQSDELEEGLRWPILTTFEIDMHVMRFFVCKYAEPTHRLRYFVYVPKYYEPLHSVGHIISCACHSLNRIHTILSI